MTATKLEQLAIRLLNAVEGAGKTVSRVIVDGRRIEIEILKEDSVGDFDRIDMRLGKT